MLPSLSRLSVPGPPPAARVGADVDTVPASDLLKADRQVVLAAVTQDGLALRFASDLLKDDREVVLAAVTQNGLALTFASDSLKAESYVVFTAVTQNGAALKECKLKANREIVKAAVKQNGAALQFASTELQNDIDMKIIAATSQTSIAFDLIESLFAPLLNSTSKLLADFDRAKKFNMTYIVTATCMDINKLLSTVDNLQMSVASGDNHLPRETNTLLTKRFLALQILLAVCVESEADPVPDSNKRSRTQAALAALML